MSEALDNMEEFEYNLFYQHPDLYWELKLAMDKIYLEVIFNSLKKDNLI